MEDWKRWRAAVDEKGQTGRRPLRRERAKPKMLEDPKVSLFLSCKAFEREGTKGEREDGDDFLGRSLEGEAREVRKLKRAERPRPDLTRWEAKRGTA